MWTVDETLFALCSEADSDDPVIVSNYVFLQKQLSRFISNNPTYFRRFLFGTLDLTEDQEKKLSILNVIADFHLLYPMLNGKLLLRNNVLPYMLNDSSFDADIVNELSKIAESNNNMSLVELESCVNALDEFLTFEQQKEELRLILEKITEFFVERNSVEQKLELPKLYDVMGSSFVEFKDKYGAFLRKTGIEVDSEIVFDGRDFRSALDVILRKAEKKNKIPSGYSTLDRNFLKGGFESGRVYVFGAKPGHGKSILLLNMCYNTSRPTVYEDGFSVYVTLENDEIETVDRLLKMVIGTNEGKRRDLLDKDLCSVGKGILQDVFEKFLSDNKIVIKYMAPGSTTTTLFAWLSTFSSSNKIKILFVDYLSLLRSGVQSEAVRFELGYIVLELRKISKYFNIPVVTAVQLNTAGYKGIPNMSNVDESRKIAQNADFMCFMFDPSKKPQAPISGGDYVLIGFNVDKNRNGPKGIYYLYFHTKFLKFVDTGITENVGYYDTDVSEQDTKELSGYFEAQRTETSPESGELVL